MKNLGNHILTVRGKHNGKPLDKIPLRYLDWLIGQEWMGFKYTEDARAIKKYLKDPTIVRELKSILKYFSTKNIWQKEKEDYIRLNYETDGEKDDQIFSIKKESNGMVRFTEECDQYFTLSLTKEEAIEMLQEAIDWIKQ